MTVNVHDFQFVLELYRQTPEGSLGEKLATARVTPDFEPALECARFDAFRRHPEPCLSLGGEKTAIEPDWHDELGEPWLQGVSAVVERNGDGPVTCHVPTSYFRSAAQKAAASLIENGTLLDGDKYRYLVSAFAAPEDAPSSSPAFEVVPVVHQMELPERSLDELAGNSIPCGEQTAADMPVFIPQSILDEAIAHMRAAGAKETGGVLIGHLHRDGNRSEIFLEITALIHARHTKEELTSLEFTHETWVDVDAAINLRGQNEKKLAWWHTHPAREWCRNCPEENRRVCKLSGEFFSSQDMALHRTVFPRAYSVALVISDSYAEGLSWPMFGWRDGMIQQRGFSILNDT